jgi:hypothetical protein
MFSNIPNQLEQAIDWPSELPPKVGLLQIPSQFQANSEHAQASTHIWHMKDRFGLAVLQRHVTGHGAVTSQHQNVTLTFLREESLQSSGLHCDFIVTSWHLDVA